LGSWFEYYSVSGGLAVVWLEYGVEGLRIGWRVLGVLEVGVFLVANF